MRLRTVTHLCGEGVSGVWDNGLLSLAAVSTVAISLFVLALMGLLALNMQHLARVVDAQVQVVAYLQPTNSSPPESQIVQQISALPGVTNAVFVSKAVALKALAQQFGQDAALISGTANGPGGNPLPDAVNIYVGQPSAVAGVVAAVQRMNGVSLVTDAPTVVDKLLGFNKALQILGIFLVAALALATVVVIGNTVRVAVYARRDQIAIMKLVGATNSFIRWPFFVEGAVLGLIGAIVSGAVIWWGYRWVASAVAKSMSFLPLLPPGHLVLPLDEVLLAAGVVLGAMGSALSVRRHLHV